MKASERLQQIETYYFAKKLDEVKALSHSGQPIINLGIGSPDIDTPKPIIEVLTKASNQKGSGQYQPYNGIPELRLAFSKWYKEIYKVCLDPQNEILPLMGSKESVMHIHLAFCNVGDSVLIPNPGYPTYASSAKILGLKAKGYNLNEENHWLPNFNELESLVNSTTKVLWVNYPHMPTGFHPKPNDLTKLINFAQKHKLLLVNDNPYGLIRTTKPISIHACNTNAYKDVLELNSLSKSHNMSGWRVGVVSGHQENITHLLTVKSNLDSGMFKPIQLAAIKALTLGESWYNTLNIEYEQRAKIAWEILDALNCTFNKTYTGLFIWAKVGLPFTNGSALADYLLKHCQVFVTPGHVFGSNGNQHIRLSLCATQTQLSEVLLRINQNRL